MMSTKAANKLTEDDFLQSYYYFSCKKKSEGAGIYIDGAFISKVERKLWKCAK